MESSLPPRPTSTTPISMFERVNNSNAVAVRSSNSVAPMEWVSLRERMCASAARKALSEITLLLTWIQSQRWTRWGLVKRPTRRPEEWRVLER